MTSLLARTTSKLSNVMLTTAGKLPNSENTRDENTLVGETLIVENANCFLCDRSFVEGEGTFLMFENRLREDGEMDNPLSVVLSTALGVELNGINVHSALLCEHCNKNVLEFERLLQSFCEMRIRIITSYNRTVQCYNIDPIIIDFDGVVTTGNKRDVRGTFGSTITSKDAEDDPNKSNHINESQIVSVMKCGDLNLLREDSIDTDNTELNLDDSVADLVEEIFDNKIIPGECINSKIVPSNDPIDNIENRSEDVTDMSVYSQHDMVVYEVLGETNRNSQTLSPDPDDSSKDPLVYDPDNSNDDTATLLYTIKDASSGVECETGVDGQLKRFKMVFEQHDHLYFCLLCVEEKAMTAEPFTEHMLKNHDLSFFTCIFCDAGFLSAESVKDHIRKEHVCENTENKTECYECNMCHRVFTNDRLLRAHKRTHNSAALQYECSECHKKYNCRNLLLDHMNMHTGRRPYKCTSCSKDFASKYTLQAHMKTHSERLRPYKCDVCNKAFLNQQTLIHHLKLHMGMRTFICDICSKAFGTQHNLDVHKIVHSGQRPFICRTCGKAFARRAEIKDHERIHTGEKPYKCDMCDAAFAQRSNLMTHRKSTHLNEKLHKCDQCGRSFKRRRLLQYHINAVHTGVRPHECEICGSSFVYPEHKKKHMLIHGNSKPYMCEVCGKEFNSCANRNAHRFVHSTKKPYECLECGAGFMRKPLLLTHMKHTGHTNNTIIVNQPQINDNGNMSLSSEVSIIDSCDEANEVITSNSQDSNSTAGYEILENIVKHADTILNDDVEADSTQYLQFDDLEKDGHQILSWVDIGQNSV